MKASKSLVLISLLPLTLVACSSENDESSTPTFSPMESISPAITEQSADSTPSQSSSQENTSSSEAASPESSLISDVNDRGNIELELGDEAVVTSKEDDKTVYSFKVNSFEIDPQCTEEFAQPSENGHLVKVNIDVVTSDAKTMDDSYYSSLNFSGFGWKYIAANGTTFNGNLGSTATFSCLPQTELLPASIGPAEKVTGSVLLDVPATDGTLVYEDSALGSGWEYKIQQ